MKTAKIYTVTIDTKQGTPREVVGTLEELITYVSYTLEVGNSWNKSVNRNPKTIKALVSSYNKAVDEKMAGCYNRYYMNLVN